jgi:hypothetical protein
VVCSAAEVLASAVEGGATGLCDAQAHVHAWGYDRLAVEEQGKYRQAVFRLVVEAIEGCGRAPEDKLRLVPHVMGALQR